MRLLTKSFPSSAARPGNLAFVSLIIFGIERIALGRIGWIAVLAIKCPEIRTRVHLECPLHIDNGLEFVEVDVSKQGKDSGGHQDNKQVLEETI